MQLPHLKLPSHAARWSRMFALAGLVGVTAGLVIAGLEWALHHGSELLAGRFTHLGGGHVLRFEWGVLLLPALGGLLSGIVLRLFCPESRGHGTDILTRAFHHHMGRLDLKAPTVKAAAAVGVIASGGSAGPEGPVAALGAALGSVAARIFGLTPRERRVLLIAGCGAGIGAIFQCPLGGALFAASIIYSEPEFEADAIVPSFVASVVAYSTFMAFWGFGKPLIQGAEQLVFSSPAELIPYGMLGLLCGLVAIFFALCMRVMEKHVVPASRLPRWLAPAIGGLATGALACLIPQVMDGQYRFIQNAVSGHLPGLGAPGSLWGVVGLFAAVVIAKCVATAFTVGSGASGGLLGPSVFIGGSVGALLGALILAIAPPGLFPPDLQAALIPVGMGGVLAACMRTPLAAIVMVTEMTGSYGLIVPSMLVCVSAYVVGRRYGLNHEQVRTAADSPAHAADALIHVLESWTVSDLIDRRWPDTVMPDATLGQMVERLRPGTRPVFAVAEGDRLHGLVSVTDIREIMQEPGLAEAVIAADMMTTDLVTAKPDQDAYEALSRLEDADHDVIPVLTQDQPPRWLGMLTRQHIFDALSKEVSSTHRHVLREHSGLAAISKESRLQHLVMGVSPAGRDIIQRLLVPMQSVGKSLREADFRNNFNVQVIAIEQPDGTLQCPPDIDAPLSPTQRLVAVVPQEPVEEE